MSNYWEDVLYPQFLGAIDSCTLSELTNYEIQSEIDLLALKSVNDFKFPRVALTYLYNSDINPSTQSPYGYYFVNSITQKEFNVILARMKQY
jgi:hypothetical protein